jgi:outer membrane protein TolC
LRLNSGLNFNRSQNAAGFTLVNQNFGPFAGLSLQIPLYNGNSYKVQKDIAIYNMNSARLQQEELLHSLLADATRTYQSYSTQLRQMETQEQSLEMASRLIQVVMERFRYNQATILEVKAAQASYEGSGFQLINLKYAAKVAEIELNRLIYKLGE